MSENKLYCKRIAAEIEAIYRGECLGEDGEAMSLYDYIANALDIQYIVDGRREYLSCRIWVTLGGPNVWIDTETASVRLAWGSDRSEYALDTNVCNEIDAIMEEWWEM